MNDTNDKAFEPMDAAVAVGEKSDGTVSYKIVEGNEYLDGKLVGKTEVGRIQIEEPKIEG